MRNEEFDGDHDDSDEDENHSDVGAPTQAARGVLQAVIEHVASQWSCVFLRGFKPC